MSKTVIDQHNATVAAILKTWPPTQENERYFNCKVISWCPPQGNVGRNVSFIRKKLQVDESNDFKTYIRVTENTFKTRWYSMRISFRHLKNMTATGLGKHLQELRDKNFKQFQISWSILKMAKLYRHGSQRKMLKCDLCLMEKLEIQFQDRTASTLRRELMALCRRSIKCNLSTKGITYV